MNVPDGIHRYPRTALLWEISIAVFVALAAMGLSALFPLGSVIWLCCIGVLALCLAYLSLIGLRAVSVWRVSETGIEQRSESILDRILGRSLIFRRVEWATLTDVRLKFYATRQDQENGWFELTLVGPRGRIRLQDSVTGFDQVLHRAALAADKRALALNAVTQANLQRFRRPVGSPLSRTFTQGRPPV